MVLLRRKLTGDADEEQCVEVREHAQQQEAVRLDRLEQARILGAFAV